MRRVPPVALLSLLLVAAPAVLAQRSGGGHAGGFSGGHPGGLSGGFASHGYGGFSSPGRYSVAAPRSFAGAAPRAFGAAPRFGWSGPGRSYGGRPVISGYRGHYSVDHSGRTDRGHYRPPYRGYGGGYGGYLYSPFINSWELLPWDLGYPDFTGYDDSYDNGSNYVTAPAEQPAEADAAEDPGYRPDYGGSGYEGSPWMPPSQAASQPVSPEPELTLIFKDGHRQAIRNYALTPDTVIVMDQASTGRQLEIPLAELNLPATEQAAQQAGLRFSPPA